MGRGAMRTKLARDSKRQSRRFAGESWKVRAKEGSSRSYRPANTPPARQGRHTTSDGLSSTECSAHMQSVDREGQRPPDMGHGGEGQGQRQRQCGDGGGDGGDGGDGGANGGSGRAESKQSGRCLTDALLGDVGAHAVRAATCGTRWQAPLWPPSCPLLTP